MRKVFRLTIDSPYGKQPVEQFKHWMSKVRDESLERWGIDIQLEPEPPKARYQIVASDGSILGEVHAQAVGGSISDRVETALKNEYDNSMEIRRVEQSEQATKDDFERGNQQ